MLEQAKAAGGAALTGIKTFTASHLSGWMFIVIALLLAFIVWKSGFQWVTAGVAGTTVMVPAEQVHRIDLTCDSDRLQAVVACCPADSDCGRCEKEFHNRCRSPK